MVSYDSEMKNFFTEIDINGTGYFTIHDLEKYLSPVCEYIMPNMTKHQITNYIYDLIQR
jgi:hypothetical protein